MNSIIKGLTTNADMQFTKEIEENGKIPFLDCLVTRDNNRPRTTIYRSLEQATDVIQLTLTLKITS